MEDIDGLNSCLARLLVAKHQVNPLMEIPRHKITFQSLQLDYIYIVYTLRVNVLWLALSGCG